MLDLILKNGSVELSQSKCLLRKPSNRNDRNRIKLNVPGNRNKTSQYGYAIFEKEVITIFERIS